MADRQNLTISATLALAAISFFPPAAPAQSTPLPLRFTVFSSKPITTLAFAARMGAAPQKIVFYPTARSPRYEYRGAMPLRFIDTTSGAVVAEATIPPEIRDALLLFTAIEPLPAAASAKEGAPVATAGKAGAPANSTGTRQTQGLRYQIAVLDDGAARHGAGGLAIINLSGLALSGTVGPQAVTLATGLNPTLTVGRSAKIALHTTLKNRTYQSYADTLQLTTKQRALLILFPPFYKGSLEVQSRLLVDEPPAVPTIQR